MSLTTPDATLAPEVSLIAPNTAATSYLSLHKGLE